MKISEFIAVSTLWGGLILGVLSLHDMSGLSEHSVCGPWGCGPPTNALVAVHLGWAAILWPPLLYLPWRLEVPKRSMNQFALVLIAAGVTGIFTVTGWQWYVWLPQASQWAQEFIWRRCGFVILTATDWPLLQSTIGGVLLLVFVRKTRNDRPREADVCDVATSQAS